MRPAPVEPTDWDIWNTASRWYTDRRRTVPTHGRMSCKRHSVTCRTVFGQVMPLRHRHASCGKLVYARAHHATGLHRTGDAIQRGGAHMKSIFRSTKKTLLIGVAFELLIAGTVRAQCVGYAGPGGPCSTGPGGGLSTGPGGGLSTGPGGGLSTGPGGGLSTGPGGGLSTGPGGGLSTGPGGGLSTGPGGGLSTGPGGGLSTGPGGGLSNGPNPWRRVPAPRYLGEDGSDDDSDDE
jgi:hypothetical protein